MKRIYLLILTTLLLGATAYAQNGRDIHGTVIDSTKQAVPSVTVKIFNGTDTLRGSSDIKGAFVFPGVKATQITVIVSAIGYDPKRVHLVLDNTNNPVFLRPIVLKASSVMLGGVTIHDVLPVKVKEDTVEFNTAAYPVRDGAPIQDMIAKVPGADVDAQGNVTFQGKSVTHVRVNGKDFFGGDLKTATQNLPADAVQNVQFVNDYGDQANLTGIKTGEPETILNINIKQSRNHGIFGQVSAGGGADAIPQVDGTTDAARYILQGNLFDFNGDQQIAVLGNYNNTNTNLFTFGGANGGGGRGGPGGPPPGSNNNTNGITTARSIGFNYRDNWSKKVTVYGSFSFSDNSVYTVDSTIQKNITFGKSNSTTQSGIENDTKVNARFTFNLEYKPDTVNYLKVTPAYSFASVHTTAFSRNIEDTSEVLDQYYNLNTLSRTSTPSYGINALYNHRFNSHGRNFSINIGAGNSISDSYQNPIYLYQFGAPNAPLNQHITTNSNTDTVSTYVSYIEPLTRRSYLELNYYFKGNYTTSDKETDTLATDGALNNYALLSNDYQYNFLINRGGLNYRFVEKKYNYVLGITGQESNLTGTAVNIAPTSINAFNLSPNAHFVYNFSRTQSFSASYSGSSVMPTYSELQPVTDFSNATYPIIGNPDLKQQYNNTFSIRYNNFNFQSGNVFFTNFSFIQSDNYIASQTIYYPSNYTPDTKLSNTIATTYTNASGYYSTSAFFVFNKPWDNRRYNLFMVGNFSYANNISYITNVAAETFIPSTEENIAKTLTAAPSVRFRLDITDVVDAQASTTYTINSSQNSIPQQGLVDNYRSLALGLNGKNYFFKDWTYSYDYTKTFYYNYPGAKNPNVFNTYVERRFLKGNMATLRFSVLDVFNQNTGYTATQSGTSSSIANYNRLGRYYLLTFTYRFQKLAGKAPQMGPGRGFGPPPGGGPGPGGPPPGGGPGGGGD
jgi:hypothetical protein